MENILQFFSIWQKLKVTVSTLFTAPRDFKFSETLFFTHCHIRANFATLRSEKVADHFTLSYLYTVQWNLLLYLYLYLRLLRKNSWKHLESNFYQRKHNKSWNFTEKNIIPYLINLETCHFSNEEIHMAAGVLDTNCFEIKACKKVK